MKQDRPNILLITCDQLRSDFVGCCGGSFMKTPNIDRLAEEGCVFENAYSPNPVCIPARHNLLTGLTARHHGFDDNYFGAEAKACPYYLPTFPQVLNDGGYETIAIGKMHFQPERRAAGFDYFLNMDELPRIREEDDYAMYLKEKGYGHLQSVHGVRTCLYMQPQRSLVPPEHHGSAWVADRAIEYLDATKGRTPFLLWAGFIHPHPPFDIPEGWEDLYKGKIPAPAKSKTPLSALAEENKQLGCAFDDEVKTRIRELYASAVSFADYQIGRILDTLDRLKLTENTLVVFTSDHGEMLGDLDTYQKFQPYDASAKIPMVVRYPGHVKPGERRSYFVDLNDLLPTFLDEAGLEYPADYDLPGESIFVGDGRKNRKYQYTEHQRNNKRWCCLRDERYKYVYYYGDDEQLFDLKEDPAEAVNLLWGERISPEITAVRDRLKTALLAYERRYGLKGYAGPKGFKEMERYHAQPYYETNFPIFPSMALEEERAQFDDYTDEILAAVKHEPVVRLSKNHTEEILKQYGGYSDERFRELAEKAKEEGCW